MQQREVTITDGQWRVARVVLFNGITDELAKEELGLSVDTIKSHMRKVFRAAAISSRTELAVQVWSGRLDLLNSHGESLIASLERSLNYAA